MIIRVVLVDDQALFRQGLRTLLGRHEGILVVGEAHDGESALRCVAATPTDVVLMDLHMPGLDGIAATARIMLRHPHVKVIALTTFDDDASIFSVVKAGAIGYLLKDADVSTIVAALHAAHKGTSVLTPSVARRVLGAIASHDVPVPTAASRYGLSPREHDVLRLLARGASNKEVAIALDVTEGTVKNHVTRIFEKLGVDDRTTAALRAREVGLA